MPVTNQLFRLEFGAAENVVRLDLRKQWTDADDDQPESRDRDVWGKLSPARRQNVVNRLRAILDDVASDLSTSQRPVTVAGPPP